MTILKSCFPIFVIAALLNVGVPHGRAVNVQPPRLKSESQIRSEAGIYDNAIREISRIENMPLATLDDFAAVRAIVQRQVPNLKFSRSKLVSFGFTETSFVSAVRAKTSDQAKADQFALELAASRDSIYRLSGALSLKDKIARKGQADLALLNRVATKIEKAANELKNKTGGHHADPSPLVSSLQRNVAVEFFSAVVITSLVISAAMIVGGPFALTAIFLLATAVVGGVITASYVAAAAAIVANVVDNVGTEEGRAKVAECLAQADRRFADCAQQGAIVTALVCMPVYLADAAACLVKE